MILWVDSSDQIQIRIFKIHNLSVFGGKGFEKNIFDKRFSEQEWFTTNAVNVWPSNWIYVSDALTLTH